MSSQVSFVARAGPKEGVLQPGSLERLPSMVSLTVVGMLQDCVSAPVNCVRTEHFSTLPEGSVHVSMAFCSTGTSQPLKKSPWKP